jgi:hypothetical protein
MRYSDRSWIKGVASLLMAGGIFKIIHVLFGIPNGIISLLVIVGLVYLFYLLFTNKYGFFTTLKT